MPLQANGWGRTQDPPLPPPPSVGVPGRPVGRASAQGAAQTSAQMRGRFAVTDRRATP